MPTPALKIQPGPLSIAYKWLCRRLWDDPDLKSAIKVFALRSTEEGVGRKPTPADDFGPQSGDGFPMLRLTPNPEPGRVVGKKGPRIIRIDPILVDVELICRGVEPATSMDLASAVWNALIGDYFAHGNLAGMYAAYVNSIDLVTAPTEFVGSEPVSGLIHTAGQIRLNVRY